MTTSKTNPQVADGTLPPVVGLPNGPFRCIVADLFLLTYHAQCATMAEMKGYRHE